MVSEYKSKSKYKGISLDPCSLCLYLSVFGCSENQRLSHSRKCWLSFCFNDQEHAVYLF